MATGDLIFADSFQHYKTAAGVLSPAWTSIVSAMTSAVVGDDNRMFDTGGIYDQTLLAAGNGSGAWSKTLPASYAAGTVGTYFRTGVVTSGGLIVALLDSGTLQLDVRYTATGAITVTRNGTVLATSTNTLAVNTAYHIELLATISDAAGTYEVKVNGSSTGWIPAATSQDTKNTANASFNEVRVYSRGSNDAGITNHRFAHLYVVEGLSSVGRYVGHTMRPAGAGYINDFTGNFGSNWLNLADPDNDSDSTFNQSATDTNKDAFVLQAAPTGTIHSVQATLNVRQDAGSGHTIRAFLRIAGTNYYGAAQTVTATYQMLQWTWTVNPATGVAWVTADLAAGAIELGYERVS